MSAVIKRNADAIGIYEYLQSVHTPDYPTETWLRNPDTSGVDALPQRYWKVVDDTVVEKTQGEKDAVDAAIEADRVAHLEAAIVETILVPDDEAASPAIFAHVEGAPIWTDTVSGEYGPPGLMQALVNRREIFGDTENPISPSGYPGALVNRATNLEAIHGKGGWHHQQVAEARYYKPLAALFYYGWLSSFNSAINGWDNDKVIRDVAKYGVVVFGSGLADPGHTDYANTTAIVAGVKAWNPSCRIFGYVDATLAKSTFEAQCDDWDDLEVHGVFMDKCGYDYSLSRATFNERVAYVHSMGSASLAFANAWNEDHVLGTANDASYPNSTWNAGLVASALTANDWYLLESFGVNSAAYTGSGGYEAKADWAARGVKAIGHRYTYGINTAAVGVVENSTANGHALARFGFLSACVWSLEAWGTSDIYYGASSSRVDWWDLPDVSGLGLRSLLSPSVQVDPDDADVYWRHCERAWLMLDFSSGAQAADVVGFGGERLGIDPWRRVTKHDDFIGPDLDWYQWTHDSSGAGSGLTLIEGDNGILRVRAAGLDGAYATLTTAIASLRTTQRPVLRAGLKLVQTADFRAYIGYYKDASNRLQFKANPTTGHWHTVSTNGGTSTDNETAVDLDTNFHNFSIELVTPGLAVFRIDDRIVGVHAANLPDADDLMYIRVQVARDAGAVNLDAHVDYIAFESDRGY